MTVTYLNESVAGLTQLGTDLGGFFSNFMTGIIPGIFSFMIIGGIFLIFTALAGLIARFVVTSFKSGK